jgi:hypothetical protein
MRIYSLLLFLFVSIAWCYSTGGRDRSHSSERLHYRFDIADDPNGKRFVLTLKSLDQRPLCIGVGQWPNAEGQLDFGSSWVTVESPEGTYRPRDHNFGYCPDCEIHIAPGSTLTGFINYEEFGDAAIIARLSRRELRFPVTLWICKRR